MTTILGIDAAWTARQPSGVSLVQGNLGHWRVLCVAPSYSAFIGAGRGIAIDWAVRPVGGHMPPFADFLGAARNLGANYIDIVALDIPLARTAITSRRQSDSAISKAFGGKGCSAHSPNASRPGPISSAIYSNLMNAGFALQTADTNPPSANNVIEVFPHPALLALLNRAYRVPYKVSKSTKYWRGTSLKQRTGLLLAEFGSIYSALQREFGNLTFDLPNVDDLRQLSGLKRYEDALDALVCAWIGQQHSVGRTEAYGDENSAIWVPTRLLNAPNNNKVTEIRS
jgi:predicted RNase H-like nuclease